MSMVEINGVEFERKYLESIANNVDMERITRLENIVYIPEGVTRNKNILVNSETGKCVTISPSELAYELEPSEEDLIARFAEEHPAIVEWKNVSIGDEYKFVIEIKDGESFGRTDIGDGRSKTYRNVLKPHGLKLDVVSFEYGVPFDSYETEIHIYVEVVEDE